MKRLASISFVLTFTGCALLAPPPDKGDKGDSGAGNSAPAESTDSTASSEEPAAAPADDGALQPGHYRVLVRGQAPEWTGEAWSFDGSGTKFAWRDSRNSDNQILVSWPEAADKDGAKVTGYLLVFTGPPAGSHN